MMLLRKKQLLILACLSLGLLLEMSVGILAPTSAQSNDSPNSKSSSTTSFKPPESDAPERTVGGGSRPSSIGLCPQDRMAIDKPLTALLSAREQAVTIASRPTFFVYLPKTEAKQISLTIVNATESYYYEGRVALVEKAGIVGITLPEDAPELQEGESYTWSLTILCGKAKRPSDPYVSGSVKRIAADAQLTQQLDTASWEKQTSLYEANGIWYDALNAAALWKEQQPENSLAIDTWTKMLQSVSLGQISSEELIMGYKTQK
jgi:hypothetical protein